MKVVTTSEMRGIEAASAQMGLSGPILMENAGKAFALAVRNSVKGVLGREILVLVGPGNNGGDGLVAARYLSRWGASVRLYLFKPRPDKDRNWQLVREYNLDIGEAYQDVGQNLLAAWLKTADVVIDAVFGTGNNRPLQEYVVAALDQVSKAQRNLPKLRVIALDMPSGLNADSGAADSACLYVNETVTLGFPKVGLFNLPGMERAGQITVADIGIPDDWARDIKNEYLTPELGHRLLPRRPFQSNKGSFGKAMVAGGSSNYIGAAYLAVSGAMRVGTGLVTLATPRSLLPALASKLIESTFLPLPEIVPGFISPEAADVIIREAGRYNALLVGCGLGQEPDLELFMSALRLSDFGRPQTLILDADALNGLSRIPDWWSRLSGAVLTPHPGEMARLAGIPVESIQSSRVETARRFALKWNSIIVLKGAYTLIASPDGRCRISPFANPGLATAGTGDVLAGVIAGLLAQGMTPYDGASLAVYLHGAAGDMVRHDMGDAGMLAGDLLPILPKVIKELRG
jgi:hydroxyethylthiazole kinase-like uncharacterized protein yjeF